MPIVDLKATMELKFAVQTKIQKPVSEVFDAIHNPKKLSVYFTNGGADGPLDEGKTVLWKFNDSGSEVLTVPVKVHKVVPNKLIQLDRKSTRLNSSHSQISYAVFCLKKKKKKNKKKSQNKEN